MSSAAAVSGTRGSAPNSAPSCVCSARADLSLARIFEGHVNAVGLVCRYGTQAQIEGLAGSVRDGALSAVWGADDAQGLRITPERDGNVLKGRKILASGAGFVTRPLVTASAPEGQQMCLLDLEIGYAHDTSSWQAQGMRATATGTVDFTGRRITDRERIGAPGDFMRQPHFSGGAWRFCAVHTGATERLVDLFREHLNSSARGEDAYQLERLATCVADATTARFGWRTPRAVWRSKMIQRASWLSPTSPGWLSNDPP